MNRGGLFLEEGEGKIAQEFFCPPPYSFNPPPEGLGGGGKHREGVGGEGKFFHTHFWRKP